MQVLDYTNYAAIARKAAAEGIILLRNRNNVLPIEEGKEISLFGRGQIDTVYSGTGSGGQVNVPYVATIKDGLEDVYKLNSDVLSTYEKWLLDNPYDNGMGWARTPWHQVEMPLDNSLLINSSETSDHAIYVLSRVAGEDRDNISEKGSYYLTDDEMEILKNLRKEFKHLVVLLNVGNIIDMSWQDEIDPDAILYVWQGGCEGGNAVADVISGAVNPSGHLPDSIAIDLDDYASTNGFGDAKTNYYDDDIYVGYRYFSTFAPDRVLYPFGFGLSYTEFTVDKTDFVAKADEIKISVKVNNTGKFAGKTAVQVYVEKPQGELGQAKLNLVDFAKTELIDADGSDTVEFTVTLDQLASFDDSGKTGHKNANVLEAGSYKFVVGFNSVDLEDLGSFEVEELIVVEQLTEAMAPLEAFERFVAVEENGKLIPKLEEAPLRELDYEERIAREKLDLVDIPFDPEVNVDFSAYINNEATLEEFIAGLTDLELIQLSRGNGMQPLGVTPGVAGATGGVSDSLFAKGIPLLAFADGPSGIRMDNGTMAFSIPIGTQLASTFNKELNVELFYQFGLEIKKNKIDSILSPGMNIHRHPLNGRNFEYFSEDPIVTGEIALAQAKGLNQAKVAATAKHFVANNQEHARHDYDSVVSARALREIYLKGFEIAVKSGELRSIMTSYNVVNGIRPSSHYELNTTILRDEWGFDGIVMTDWWAKVHWHAYEEASRQPTGGMIQSQNDLYMVTASAQNNANDDFAEEEFAAGRFTRAELVRNTKNILKFIKKYYFGYQDSDIKVENEPSTTRVVQQQIDLGLINERIIVPIENFVSRRQEGLAITFGTEEAGMYSILLEGHIDGEEAAQMNLFVYCNNTIQQSRSLYGKQDFSEGLSIGYLQNPTNYIDINFSESGFVIDKIEIYRD